MVNKVILIGNLGADPEVRYTQNGTAVASFSIATTEKYKKDNEWVEKTEWHNIVMWAGLGETCGKYLNKGSRIYVEGKLQTRKWVDKDGNNRYTTEIVGREMKMLSSRGASAGDQDQGGGYGQEESSMPNASPMGDDVPF